MGSNQRRSQSASDVKRRMALRRPRVDEDKRETLSEGGATAAAAAAAEDNKSTVEDESLAEIRKGRYKALLREEMEGFSEDVDSDDGAVQAIVSQRWNGKQDSKGAEIFGEAAGGTTGGATGGAAGGSAGGHIGDKKEKVEVCGAEKQLNRRANIGSNRHESPELTRQLQAELNCNSNRNPFKRRIRGGNAKSHTSAEIAPVSMAHLQQQMYLLQQQQQQLQNQAEEGNEEEEAEIELDNAAYLTGKAAAHSSHANGPLSGASAFAITRSTLTLPETLPESALTLPDSEMTLPPSYSYHPLSPDASAIASAAGIPPPSFDAHSGQWQQRRHRQQHQYPHSAPPEGYADEFADSYARYSPTYGSGVHPNGGHPNGAYGGNGLYGSHPPPLYGYPKAHADDGGAAAAASAEASAAEYARSPKAASDSDENRNENAKMKNVAALTAPTISTKPLGKKELKQLQQQQQLLQEQVEKHREYYLEQHRHNGRGAAKGSQAKARDLNETNRLQQLQQLQRQQQSQRNQNQKPEKQQQDPDANAEGEEDDGEKSFFSRTVMFVAALALFVGIGLGISGQRHSMAFISETPNPKDLNLPAGRQMPCTCELCPKQRGRARGW